MSKRKNESKPDRCGSEPKLQRLANVKSENIALDEARELLTEQDITFDHYAQYTTDDILNASNGKNTNRKQYSCNLNDDLLQQYKHLVRGTADKKLFNEVANFMSKSQFEPNILGMMQTIHKLRMNLEKEKAMNDRRKSRMTMCIDDFKSFLTMKTCNMFRATFTMVCCFKHNFTFLFLFVPYD